MSDLYCYVKFPNLEISSQVPSPARLANVASLVAIAPSLAIPDMGLITNSLKKLLARQ